MRSLTLHIISKSHPLWQVHAKSHLTRHIKIPPPLAITSTATFYTSSQNPTPSGKYMHSLILHVISKSHPLWQVHAQSHLTRKLKIPPPLATTCTVSSSTSYQIPPPLASTCTVSSYTSYQNPTPSGKYMHSLILHVNSKSHPLWQLHAQSHLPHHIKSHPLWQVHAQSHLTRNLKIPPPLASTCTVSSYIPEARCQNDKLQRRICSKTLWKPHVKTDDMRPHREKGSCSNPRIRWSTRPSGCMNYYICFWNHSWRSIVCGSWFTKHSWRSIVLGSWFTIHSLRAMVYESRQSWFTNHGLRAMVYESWFTIHSLRAMVYEPWFTIHRLRAMVYRSRSQPSNPPQPPHPLPPSERQPKPGVCLCASWFLRAHV